MVRQAHHKWNTSGLWDHIAFTLSFELVEQSKGKTGLLQEAQYTNNSEKLESTGILPSF